MPRRSLRDAILVHLGFAVVAGLVILLPQPALGWRLLGLVVLYNVVLPLVGTARGHAEWVSLWAFLVPLSVFQVVPDAVLADVIGSIDFPDTGGPRLGSLPLAMAGMWTIPLWASLFAADRLARGSVRRGAAWAAVIAGAVLVGSEAVLWAVPIWQAVGVRTVGPVAVYVIVPEILLGAVTYGAYVTTRHRARPARIAAAALVALVYTGALVASYWVIDAA